MERSAECRFFREFSIYFISGIDESDLILLVLSSEAPIINHVLERHVTRKF